MKTTRTHCPTALLLVALACLASLAPIAHAQGNAIATMDVDGSNAFVDNARQRPSARDIEILDGNMVRTGQRTSALVEIVPEGSVQLNENSAKLITSSFFKGARCFAVRLISGELLVNGENVCFLTNVGAVSGISHSRINIKVDERGTVLTVIEGSAELDEAPASMLVSASEQLVVLPNGEYYKNVLDPAAAERTAEWTKNYFNAPPPKKGMSKGAKTALGILGAIIVGTAIHEATDDDDDHDRDDRNPPPQPSPRTPQPSSDAAPTPPSDAPPPPPSDTPRSSSGAGFPSSRVLQPSPAYQLQPEACCVVEQTGTGTTHQVTPAQCKAMGGYPGTCPKVN